MVTKTITITEDAYAVLARQKKKTESFSEEIVRLLKKKGSIMDLAGAWSDMDEGVAEQIRKNIEHSRNKWGKRALERMHDLS